MTDPTSKKPKKPRAKKSKIQLPPPRRAQPTSQELFEKVSVWQQANIYLLTLVILIVTLSQIYMLNIYNLDNMHGFLIFTLLSYMAIFTGFLGVVAGILGIAAMLSIQEGLEISETITQEVIEKAIENIQTFESTAFRCLIPAIAAISYAYLNRIV